MNTPVEILALVRDAVQKHIFEQECEALDELVWDHAINPKLAGIGIEPIEPYEYRAYLESDDRISVRDFKDPERILAFITPAHDAYGEMKEAISMKAWGTLTELLFEYVADKLS